MVQESDEPDPETGELAWTEERDDMDDGEGGAEKVYIGKVRRLPHKWLTRREADCSRRSPSCSSRTFASCMSFPKATSWNSTNARTTRCGGSAPRARARLADLICTQGGYFVINGSEKVLIAQERMAANRVYVFAKTQPSPVTYLAEIRSAVEKGGKTISSMQIKMMRRNERQVRGSVGAMGGNVGSPGFCCRRAARRSRRRCPTSATTSPSSSSSVRSTSSPTRTFSTTSATTTTTLRCLRCSSRVSRTRSRSKTRT